MSKNTISRQISNLAELGFIRVEMIYAENSNQILERRICLSDITLNRPYKNITTPIIKNGDTPIIKNEEGNNKYNNTKINSDILSDPISSVLDKPQEKTDKIGSDKIPTQTAELEKEQKKEGFPSALTNQSFKRTGQPPIPGYCKDVSANGCEDRQDEAGIFLMWICLSMF